MRTLLRHTKTGLFFEGPHKWTDNAGRAYDFRFIDRALSYVQTWHLKEVELAFAFEDPASITVVPLEKSAERYSAVA